MDSGMMPWPRAKKSRQSGSGLAALAAGLTKRLADQNPTANLVFSPLSIYAAVALLAPGARGDTLDEVLRLLGASSRDDLAESMSRMACDALQDLSGSGGPSVAFACGVWNDERRPLKPAYRDAVVGTYRAEARAVDFRENAEEAAEQINAWVAEVTKNLIKDVVSARSLGPETQVVLANAIYFKGNWAMPFDERDTKDRPFHRLDGTAVDAPFMSNPGGRHCIAVHDGFKVLKLHYKMPQPSYQQWPATASFKQPTRYSMCIFLPDAHDGLRSLVDEMTSRPGFVLDHLPQMPVKVGDFGVPKFKLEYSNSIVGILKQLGLVLPFGGMGSDLSDMVEHDGFPLAVQDVIHKAVIEVNEEGTEAAALTMMIAAPGCSPMMMTEPRVDFVADHPFAYFIVEEASGTIMFAGHVVDPSNGKGRPVRIGQQKHPRAPPQQLPQDRGFELPPVTRNLPVQLDMAGTMGNPGSTGLAALAAGLVRQLTEGRTDRNLVFSPLSIYTALSLLAVGAKDATLDEILRVLGARSCHELETFVSTMAADALRDRSTSGGPRVAFACGVWTDTTTPLKPAFRETVVGTYKAEASTVNFRGAPEEARGQINAWAAQVTRNLIDEVLLPGMINHETTVVLGNAIYFKGKWEHQPFHRRNTVQKPFHRLDGSQLNVPFMQSGMSQFVAVHHGFKVLKLRYKMATPDQKGVTQEHAHDRPSYSYQPGDQYVNGAPCKYRPVGQFEPNASARFNHGDPSPNYFPTGLYFQQSHCPPPPFSRPYPYGALGRFGHPPNPPYALQHVPFGSGAPTGYPSNAFGNPNVPDPWSGNPYQSQRAALPGHSGTQFSMCIFLPDAHDGLWGLLDMMASRPGFLHDHLPEQRIALREFRMPKFKLSFHDSIAPVVMKLGLKLPFCKQGNLSDMVEDDCSGLPIVVGDVIQKAVVEVNEEGTEAAAVTMVVGVLGCAAPLPPPPPPQVDFIADHPFAYYIVEEATGAIVFAGHVLDPSKE